MNLKMAVHHGGHGDHGVCPRYCSDTIIHARNEIVIPGHALFFSVSSVVKMGFAA